MIDDLIENFDPWDGNLAADPDVFWAVVNGIRDHGPVRYSRHHGGFWVIAGYDEVLKANRDWEVFSSAQGAAIPHNPDIPRLEPIEVDPPVHGDWRRLLNPLMSEANVRKYEPEIRRIARNTMDEFVELGECDLAKDFAWRFVPESLFELVLGVPQSELEGARDLVQRFISSEGVEQQQALHAELALWAEEFLVWRRTQPHRGDVTDALLNGSVGGERLTTERMVNTMIMMVLAGMETTASSISNVAQHLIDDPSICQHFLDRGLVDSAIEELLRHGSVSFGLARTATRDIDLGGVRILTGERVFLLWAAANRDPSKFRQPDRFDIGRPKNQHLAFGSGPHRCMGLHFAKLLLRVATTEIVVRMPHLRAKPEGHVRHDPGLVRSTRELPVTFDPTPRSRFPRS